MTAPGSAPAPVPRPLAERFGVAKETAARAHTWLTQHGYVVAVPGVGMVVTPRERWKPGQWGEWLGPDRRSLKPPPGSTPT